MIEEGASDADVTAYMRQTYLASKEKIDLSLQVSHKEHELLSKIDYDNGYSVYIGIPFCPSTCLYCSFTSYPIGLWTTKLDDYIDALEKEMAFTAQACKDKSLTTIYIGGGTPTSLDEEHMEKLLSLVDKYFDTKSLLEYTIEAGRPDSITYEKLQVMKNHPVTRISINPQTMNQKTLDLIGRFHKVEDINRVFGWARELGFDNINMDMILGLPG
jgi:oxygen-independent coproporphyrinogen-3 oxidase